MNTKHKKYFLLLLLFVISLLARISVWFFGLADMLGWVIYDIDVYTTAGRVFLEALVEFNFDKAPSVVFFHPALSILLTGVAVTLASHFLDPSFVALLVSFAFSALTSTVIYLVGEKIGGTKTGLISWGIFSFDPFLIQFSTAILDSTMLFFISFMFYLIITRDIHEIKSLILIGIVGGLAVASKHIAIPILLLTVVLFFPSLKGAFTIILVALITYILFNPQFWNLENAISMVMANTSGAQSLVPAIISGPFFIGKPLTYPWYILTYMGLGYTGIGVAPFITPLLALYALLYNSFYSRKLLPLDIAKFSIALIVPLVFLPRQYWIPISMFPGLHADVEGGLVLTKFAFPYYYIVVSPSLVLIAAYLICCENRFLSRPQNLLDNSKNYYLKFLYMFVVVFCLLSPIALVASVYFSFWEFLFTLIINIDKGPVLFQMGLTAFFVTFLLMCCVLLFSVIMWKKIKLGN